ncbi:hypothetical protein [Streptomyces sp. NPDC088137]|uniref:hypothetical protein n=1 Tax=Streptomyces sp. NPDC088137 TaxID=3365827 RepID=UPI003804E2D6
MHQSTERYLYDGTLGVPVATGIRGACSCGRRGTPRSPLGWEAVERRKPYLFDTGGPEDDWDAHIADVQARTVPCRSTSRPSSARSRRHTAPTAEGPLPAIRAAATLERTTRRAAADAAYNLGTVAGPDRDGVAQALGGGQQTARSRLTHYALRR